MSQPLKTALVWAAVLALALGLYASRHGYYRYVRWQRSERADTPGTPIGVALVWPRHDGGDGAGMPSFERGARLAAAEINGRGGVAIRSTRGTVDRRRLRLVRYHEAPLTGEREMQSEMGNMWQEPWRNRWLRGRIAHRYGILAVIGYAFGPSAVRASVTYDYNGIVLLAPAVSSSAVTAHGFEHVFRTLPSDREHAVALAREALARGWSRVGILAARSDLGLALARSLEQTLSQTHLVCDDGAQRIERGVVAFSVSYALDEEDYRPLAQHLRERPFDALVVADRLPRGAELIRQLRMAGFRQPFLGSVGLDSPRLWDLAGEAAEGTLVASPFAVAASGQGALASHLLAAYRARHGALPDFRAGQGYEAVRLLAQAIERGGSAEPERIAATFHHGGELAGLWGRLRFDRKGAVVGKHIFLKEMRRGGFRLAPPAALPPGCAVVEIDPLRNAP